MHTQPHCTLHTQALCGPYRIDSCFFQFHESQLSRGSHVCFGQINLSKRNTFAARTTLTTIAHKYDHIPKLYQCLSPFLQVNTTARLWHMCMWMNQFNIHTHATKSREEKRKKETQRELWHNARYIANKTKSLKNRAKSLLSESENKIENKRATYSNVFGIEMSWTTYFFRSQFVNLMWRTQQSAWCMYMPGLTFLSSVYAWLLKVYVYISSAISNFKINFSFGKRATKNSYEYFSRLFAVSATNK